jgi:hypothetical protein
MSCKSFVVIRILMAYCRNRRMGGGRALWKYYMPVKPKNRKSAQIPDE